MTDQDPIKSELEASDPDGQQPVWLHQVVGPLREWRGTAEFQAFAADLQSDTAELRHALLRSLQAEVSQYPETYEVRRRQQVERAIAAAAREYCALLCGAETADPDLGRLFRRLGFDDACSGRKLGLSRQALQVGTRWSRHLIHQRLLAHDLTAAHLAAVGDSLFGYAAHLDHEVSRGYELGERHLRIHPGTSRRRLLDALLTESPKPLAEHHADVAELAHNANWPLPEELVVARASDSSVLPDLSSIAAILVNADCSPAVLLCPADLTDALVNLLIEACPETTIALAWPVAPEDAARADRWARRTLELAEVGILPCNQLIHCSDHQVQLWLHAEPAVRHRLVLDLLAPLLREGQNSRTVLAETTLAWLESRESAPAIAARLGVHPQTVRYRWKRINDLLGEALHDPEFVGAITMTLRATLPLWRAGDVSDIAAYRARRQDAPSRE